MHIKIGINYQVTNVVANCVWDFLGDMILTGLKYNTNKIKHLKYLLLNLIVTLFYVVLEVFK